MTKKHFVMIAKVLKTERDMTEQDSTLRVMCDRLIYFFSDEFKKENSLFDKKRFLVACGIELVK